MGGRLGWAGGGIQVWQWGILQWGQGLAAQQPVQKVASGVSRIRFHSYARRNNDPAHAGCYEGRGELARRSGEAELAFAEGVEEEVAVGHGLLHELDEEEHLIWIEDGVDAVLEGLEGVEGGEGIAEEQDGAMAAPAHGHAL